MPARTAGFGRFVARNGEIEVESQRRCPADDFRFRHRQQRSADTEAPAFHPGFGPEVRRPLEGFEKLGRRTIKDWPAHHVLAAKLFNETALFERSHRTVGEQSSPAPTRGDDFSQLHTPSPFVRRPPTRTS